MGTGLRSFALTLVAEARKDRLPGLAAEVAFWGVFSLFPALLIAAGLLGALDSLLGVDVAARAEAAVVEAMRGVLTERAAPLVETVRALFHGSSGGLLTTAALLAVWSVSSAFTTIIEALDVVYGVRQPRGWVRQRLVAVALGLASVAVLAVVLVMLVVGPLFGGGHVLAAKLRVAEAYGTAWDWLRGPTSLVGLALWATALYRFAPRVAARWRQALPGGFLAALLGVAVSAGLRLYLSVAMEGNPLLGLLGGGLILMLWFYLLALALLLGGEVNEVLVRGQAGVTGPPSVPPAA